MKLLRQDIQRALKQTDDSSALAELKLAKAVLEGHGPGGDLRKLLKQPTPALLKLLLGQHCNVMTLQVSPWLTICTSHFSLSCQPMCCIVLRQLMPAMTKPLLGEHCDVATLQVSL